MAKKFLEEVANYISTTYEGDHKDLVVILPNRRAGLFLEKYLKSTTTKTVWAPQFYSIEDFVFETTGFIKASSTDLVFELYEIYLKYNPTEQQSFDDFSSWGPRLIKDFNDIDGYLTDYEVVFNFLSEARNLQKWNLDRPKLTQLESNYLKFYAQLKNYYIDYKKRLKKLNIAYAGMAIKDLVSDFSGYSLGGKKFVIAGFSALTKAEEQLFEYLVVENKAQIFWDVDAYYLDDFKQEAGKHIRKIINNSRLQGKTIISDEFKGSKNITISGLTGNYAMVKYAAQVLEDLTKNKDFNPNDTAIILPDEELLFPLLNALPDSIKETNITMSYPYKKSEAYDLIIRLIDLYNSAARIQNTGQESRSILLYHKAIKKLLNTALFKQTYGESVALFLQKIKTENLTLLTFQQAEEIANEIGMQENNPWQILSTNSLDIKSILIKITSFLDFIESQYQSMGLDRELLILNQTIINQLLKKVENHDVIESFSTLKNLFKTLTSLKGIPFEGKPLAGVQIMGVLETRALDFSNIIYLSFNEGTFPNSTQFRSFILPEIRREYGLPMPLDDDAIHGYHFYRSIQRANNVTLIYNTTSGNMGGGEVSRFGMQLAYELKQTDFNIKIKENIIRLPNPKKYETKPIEIKKSAEILKELEGLGTDKNRGLSPTSLTNYIGCSLRFYFSKILKIRVPEEVEEEMAVNTRGNVIHETLELLYKEEALSANKFDEVFYNNAINKYPSLLKAQYKKHFKKGDINHGFNLLLKSLDDKMIKSFLQSEKKNSLGISQVEEEVRIEHFLPIETSLGKLQIKIYGLADRIDFHNGMRRIIDYKTGKMEARDLHLDGNNSPEKWINMFTKNAFPKAFQLLTYALIYNRMHHASSPIIPIIAGLKTKAIYFYLKINGNEVVDEEILNAFENDLINLIQEIYNKDIPFSQTEDEKTCKNCDYKTICNRNG